jgi:hypothetical protein
MQWKVRLRLIMPRDGHGSSTGHGAHVLVADSMFVVLYMPVFN